VTAMISWSEMRGFWRTRRRTSLFASRIRMLRASLLPRSASLIFSACPICMTWAHRLCGVGRPAASSASSTSSAGTTLSSVPSSTAFAMTSMSKSGMLGGTLRLGLLDDALGDVGGNLFVVRQLELEVAPPARHRAEVGRVAQHLRHGDVRLDELLAVA